SVVWRQGISVLYLPAGLSLKLLLQIAEQKKIPIDPVFDVLLHENNLKLLKSRVIIISNAVLAGTQDKSARAQEKRLKQLECRPPTLLEVAALIVLIYPKMLSPYNYDRSYDDSGALTRCMDFVNSGLVTGITPNGWTIARSDGSRDRSIGVGAVKVIFTS